MMMRKIKANVMRNATKQTKKNYFIVFDFFKFFRVNGAFNIPKKKHNYLV